MIYLSLCFFIQFLSNAAAATVVTKALRESGFGNLGFYFLALIYVLFGLSSFITPNFVRKFGPNLSIVLGSITFAFVMLAFSLATLRAHSETYKQYITYNALLVIFIIGILANGFGSSLLWIA